MSDLEKTQTNWSSPSPVYNKCTGSYDSSGGIVWKGDEPPTLEDFQQAEQIFNTPWQEINYDVPTFFGLPSYYTRKREGDDPCYANETVVLG